jgi:hypothetical protein
MTRISMFFLLLSLIATRAGCPLWPDDDPGDDDDSAAADDDDSATDDDDTAVVVDDDDSAATGLMFGVVWGADEQGMGAPLASAVVTATDALGIEHGPAGADATGYYELELSPGHYDVAGVSNDCWSPDYDTAEIVAGQSTEVNLCLWFNQGGCM